MPVFAVEGPGTSQRPVLDVGVIYTHEAPLMPRLLSSLAASADGLRKRLILVDNHSRDGVDSWTGQFPETKVVSNDRRQSYSANLNRILEVSKARYILLLNTDMYFDPREQCLAKMVRFMDARPDCGIAGCRLHHSNEEHAPSARRFQTLPTIFARRFGMGHWMRRTLAEYFYYEHAIDETWECDWLSGCFMMVRREAIEDVGYFDVRFGKYFEDVDMCLRMARAGWRVMYNGGTYCYHLEQRASKHILSADARQHARAYLRWLLKWGFGPPSMLPRPQDSHQPQRQRRAA